MSMLAREIRRSLTRLQEGWARLADSAFASDAVRDEAARGEFTSAFISEAELTSTPRRRPRGGKAH